MKSFIINEMGKGQENASVICADNQAEFDVKLKTAITEMVCADDNTVKFSPVMFHNCGCKVLAVEFDENNALIRISENVLY